MKSWKKKKQNDASNLLHPQKTIARTSVGTLRSSVTAPFEKQHEHHSFLYYLKKFFLFIFKILLLALFIFLAYFTWKISMTHHQTTSDPILVSAEQSQEFSNPYEDFATNASNFDDYERINILLLGKANDDYPGANLTDTIMIASIDMQKKKIALLSLPRDLYVNISDTDLYTRINSVYQYGLNNGEGITPLTDTIEDVIGQEIHYYIIADFNGFTDVIDALDGVNVDVKYDVNDTRYPGPNRSYETFSLAKGLQKMDGATALKYVRYRHGDPEGDFGRAKRQQQILQSIKNRAFSLRTFFNPFALDALLESLGTHVRTNIPAADIPDFISLLKKLDTQNIETVVIDAWKPNSLLRVMHVQHGPIRAFGLTPRAGSYAEIHDVAENIFDMSIISKRKESVASENAQIVIADRSHIPGLAERFRQYLINDQGMKNVTITDTKRSGKTLETVVTDRSNGTKPYTLDTLLKGTNAPLNNDHNYANNVTDEADIIVILGQDYKGLLYEEASIENLTQQPPQEYLDVAELHNP